MIDAEPLPVTTKKNYSTAHGKDNNPVSHPTGWESLPMGQESFPARYTVVFTLHEIINTTIGQSVLYILNCKSF